MSDVLTPEQRHRNMAAIHSVSTKPELKLRNALWHLGFRYKVNDKRLPGKPDIVLPKYRTAIFVHGCFWHRHLGCKYAYTPKTRVEFWHKKFDDNVRRDAVVTEELQKQGIKQLIIWECTINRMKKDAEFEADILSQIVPFINNQCDDSSHMKYSF